MRPTWPLRLLIVVLLVVTAAAGFLWWSRYHASRPTAWQGYAEADYVKVAPVQSGLLTTLSVARGDEVAAGAALFTLDDTNERAARDQAVRQLGQAAGQLANLEAPSKATEIAQAQANLADARATLERAAADLERGEALLRRGNAALQSVDQLRAAYRSAEARVQATAAALAQQRAPLGRDSEIEAQRAAVEALRAALAMADWRLSLRSVAAPAGGRVADVLARPGEMVAAGAPVVSILPPENIFIRFFVPEPALSSLHPGDPVVLACDGCPPGLSGTISFISPQAEYTPPVIYSESTRAKLVYLIEARPRPDQAARLNPGLPMAVRPLAGGPPP
jgi:HlyD family secretion protein